jgi:hypothetical protein
VIDVRLNCSRQAIHITTPCSHHLQRLLLPVLALHRLTRLPHDCFLPQGQLLPGEHTAAMPPPPPPLLSLLPLVHLRLHTLCCVVLCRAVLLTLIRR